MSKQKKSKKSIDGYLKLQIPAMQANPSPPVGPALGQRGINIMEFCNAFNDACKKEKLEPGSPIPVTITVFSDRSFEFSMKLPPVSFLLKKAMKLKKGSKEPGKDIVGKITRKQLEDIANAKMADLNAHDLDAAVQIIAGTARSMGIEVKG